jgi:hypothetical protein
MRTTLGGVPLTGRSRFLSGLRLSDASRRASPAKHLLPGAG